MHQHQQNHQNRQQQLHITDLATGMQYPLEGFPTTEYSTFGSAAGGAPPRLVQYPQDDVEGMLQEALSPRVRDLSTGKDYRLSTFTSDNSVDTFEEGTAPRSSTFDSIQDQIPSIGGSMDWAQDEQKPGEAHMDSKMGGDMDTKMDTQMDTEVDMKIGFGRDSMDWIQNNHQLHPPPPAAPVSDTAAKSTAKSTAISAQSAGPKLEDYKLLKVLGKGSFGKVVLVRKKDNQKLYAMKVLSKPNVVMRKQVAQ
jgi:hypothetical protein